jgi:hypothetical protein
MTAQQDRQVSRALVDHAARLVDELDHLPAGSVLRYFSRAVDQARRAG